MDLLKLAFDTVIVGLFALPWLYVMIDLVNPDLFKSAAINHVVARIPKELLPTAIGLTLFALVYLVGSMITPVSREFLNDPDMMGRILPTEEDIRASNYPPQGDADGDRPLPARFKLVNGADSKADSDKTGKANAEFVREESKVLLRAESSERLSRLHEQLTVLQGATFSAFAFTVLCGFGWCGHYSKKKIVIGGTVYLRQQLRCSVALVASSIFILFAGVSLVADAHTLESGDMPIAELVLLALGGFGLYIAVCGTRSRIKFHGLAFLFAFFFTLVCYTGYGCTEKSYDQDVFNTYQALPREAAGNSSHAATQGVLTTAIAE